jgi:hypothetical protein
MYRTALVTIVSMSRGKEMVRNLSVLEVQAADALRRARRLPVGPARNDLRLLAKELLWLDRNGMDALVERRNVSKYSDAKTGELNAPRFP